MCGMQHSKVMNILHVELSQVTGASASAVSELLTIFEMVDNKDVKKRKELEMWQIKHVSYM